MAITFYLFIDINLSIYRVFKKKQGLYYWCMLLGTWGCLINAIAVVVKSFVHDSEPLWPLYTLFMLLGWTVFAPAQLLVLYSRLHLVNQDHSLQRRVLIMIVTVLSLMITPTWPLAWQAYNPYDEYFSALYSPREAILDRCTQIGYTIAETAVNGVYIWSLTKLLNIKSSVRQRRVMMDLICVNFIAVCLDILTVVLIFVNETGISHPIQGFSYILKLKLEFVVLNQLMAVAARGVRRDNFAERRYHHPSILGEKSSPTASSRPSRRRLDSDEEPLKPGKFKKLVVPSPTFSRAQRALDDTCSQTTGDHMGKQKWNLKAKLTARGNKEGCAHTVADDDEEIGVHMWERRRKLVMEVPWFATKRDA